MLDPAGSTGETGLVASRGLEQTGARGKGIGKAFFGVDDAVPGKPARRLFSGISGEFLRFPIHHGDGEVFFKYHQGRAGIGKDTLIEMLRFCQITHGPWG
jgi:hypothetical protein